MIEVYNKTTEIKMAILLDATKDGETVWTDMWMDAVDVYNSTPHIALSDGATAAITPVEESF